MYILRWKQPSLDLQKAAEIQVPVASTVQHPTGITFTGKGAASYGSVQQQNLMRVLENFADAQPPIGPTVGQLWFDSVRKSLKICVSTSPITWANASGVAVGANPPEPQLGMLWYQTMGEVSGILHIYNGLGRYGSIYENAIGGWNQVWPQVQTVAGREEYDTMRELLEQLAGQAVSSYGSGAIGRHIQDLTDFASLDNSLRQAWMTKGTDEFTLLKKSTDTRIPRQALSNGTLFALSDVDSPNDNKICGGVDGSAVIGQNASIFINGVSTNIPAGDLPSDLNFEFAYIMYSSNNVGGFGTYRFVKNENGLWLIDTANGASWQQFTPVAGQYIIGTGETYQQDNNAIYPGMKNIFMWGCAVEIINPAVNNLKVETNSQDWDKLLAAVRYAVARLDVSDLVVQQISKMPFVRDGWQIPPTLAILPTSDIRQAPIERRANQWPSIIGQINAFQSTQTAITAALPVRHMLKGMTSGNTQPQVLIQDLTPNLTNTFASGVGRLRLAVNFDSFDDRCRFLFSGGALQLEISHVGGSLPADNNLRAVFTNDISMARFTATSTLIFIGSSPYTPGGVGNAVGLQNITDTGKVMFTKTLGGATVTAIMFRPTPTRLELQIDVNAGGQLSGTTGFKVSTVRDTTTYGSSLAVYPGPNAYDASDIISFQQIDVAPVITQNPSNTTATAGRGTSFTVNATGTAPLQYDWQYNVGNGWLSLGAANSPTLSFTAALSQSGRAYRVVVNNAAGSATSNAAILTVQPAGIVPDVGWVSPTPQQIDTPTLALINAGENYTLSVNGGNGTQPISYGWVRRYQGEGSYTPFNGTQNFVDITGSSSSDSAEFRVTGTNNFGSDIVSSPETAIVLVMKATTNSDATSYYINVDTVEFQPSSGGKASYRFEWEKQVGANWQVVPGEITSSITVSKATVTQSTNFRCKVIASLPGMMPVGTERVTATTYTNVQTLSQSGVAPQITQQPNNVSIYVGESTTLTVIASGDAPLSYQWKYSDGTIIPGATNTSLLVSPATSNSYVCTVSNNTGSVTSNIAIITVNAAVANIVNISQAPSGSVTAGTVLTFSSEVIPGAGAGAISAPFTYDWQASVNGGASWNSVQNVWPTAVNGNATFALQPAFSDTNTQIRVLVNGGAASNAVILAVTEQTFPAQITSQPSAFTTLSGSTATFTVIATGSAPISYQWFENGAAIANSNSSTYSFTTSAAQNGRVYSVRVSNPYGPSVDSNGAILTVNSVATITSQPQNATICVGSSATFAVVASGTAPLSYQWQGATALDPLNFSNIDGATSDSVAGSATSNFRSVRVVVTNAYGSETSSAASLTVNTAPNITSQPTGSNGEAVTMTVIAPGATSYQWQIFNIATSTFDNIGGATSSSYAVLGNSSILAIRYRVVVSNSCGSTISNEAIVGGISLVGYTWRVDPYNVHGGTALIENPSLGNPIGSVISTSSQLDTVTTITINGITYVRGSLMSAGTTASAGVDWQWYEYSASIGGAVGEAPSIVTQPSNQSTTEGGTLTFSSTANGTEPLTYQWELSPDGVTWSNVT